MAVVRERLHQEPGNFIFCEALSRLQVEKFILSSLKGWGIPPPTLHQPTSLYWIHSEKATGIFTLGVQPVLAPTFSISGPERARPIPTSGSKTGEYRHQSQDVAYRLVCAPVLGLSECVLGTFQTPTFFRKVWLLVPPEMELS